MTDQKKDKWILDKMKLNKIVYLTLASLTIAGLSLLDSNQPVKALSTCFGSSAEEAISILAEMEDLYGGEYYVILCMNLSEGEEKAIEIWIDNDIDQIHASCDRCEDFDLRVDDSNDEEEVRDTMGENNLRTVDMGRGGDPGSDTGLYRVRIKMKNCPDSACKVAIGFLHWD